MMSFNCHLVNYRPHYSSTWSSLASSFFRFTCLFKGLLLIVLSLTLVSSSVVINPSSSFVPNHHRENSAFQASSFSWNYAYHYNWNRDDPRGHPQVYRYAETENSRRYIDPPFAIGPNRYEPKVIHSRSYRHVQPDGYQMGPFPFYGDFHQPHANHDSNAFFENIRCSECEESLSTERSCYLKNGRIYCKKDYLNLVRANVKCSKCFRIISPNDWVRRAGSHVYHLACFACDLCQRQMSTGEQFTIDNATEDMKLLCKLHFGITTTSEGDSHDSSSNDSLSSSTPKPSKTKRVRTTFTEEQLQILQANFQIDSNPDGQDLERIATLTGLSKRVTQVWFQNSRARQKKHLNRSRGPETGPTNGLTGCGLGSGTSGSSWGNPGEVTNSNQSWSLSNNLCSDGNSN